MKFKTVINVLIIFIITSVLVYAISTGITGVTLKSSNPGCICHSPEPSGAVTVAINGPDQMAPGETANLTLTITGGPLSAGGTNIAASAGTLEPGTGLQKISDELTHTLPKAPQQGTVTFEFTYTAPSEPQTVTLFANGNSVNFNGNNFGDQWNFAPNKTILIETPADVNDDFALTSFRLEQNYPNPFNPATNFGFRIADFGFVSVKVFDISGKEVANLVNEEMEPGEYKINFNSDQYNLTAGVYLYRIIANGFSETKKMMLLK